MPGFDTNRFTDLNEDLTKHLICSICLNIFDNAIKSECEHTFCKSCVQQWIESNHKECSECRVKFTTRKRSDSTRSTNNLVLIRNYIFKCNLLANSMVSELKIKCDFEFNGCQQSVKLGLLSSHVRVCPHRLCSKCGFAFDEYIDHKCIELLKKDRNDLKEKLEKQLKVNEEFKQKYENQLEINEKLKEENREMKTKLETNEKVVQNKTNNTIAVKEVPNNEYICDSIENIYFGVFKTTIRRFEIRQDEFRLICVHSISYIKFNCILPFNECQEVMYCDDPFVRIFVIKPTANSCHKIREAFLLNNKISSIHKFNVDSNGPLI